MVLSFLDNIPQTHIYSMTKQFWLSPDEFTFYPEGYPVTARRVPEPAHEPMQHADWFPKGVQAIQLGRNMTLYQILSGTQLGPNQEALKEWIIQHSTNNQPLKVPVIQNISEYTDPEELAKIIMEHIQYGSMKMFFLPNLPMEYHPQGKQAGAQARLRKFLGKRTLIRFPV